MQLDRRAGSFDLESALAITDGDLQLLKELAELFLEDYPRLMANLRSSIEERDAKRLQMSAHALKGAVANFGAQSAVEYAGNLEQKGRAGELTGTEQDYLLLDHALGEFAAELRSLA